MNIFRFIADMLHLAAILLLLYRIKKARNCIGKSTLVPSSLSAGFSDGAARWLYAGWKTSGNLLRESLASRVKLVC